MRFEVVHSFPAEADALAAALLDPAFQDQLGAIGPLRDRKVLSQDVTTDGRVERRVRCVLGLELSGMARKVLGDQDPAWVQAELWDPVARTWEWEIHPESHAELLTASGTTTVAGEAQKSTRAVVGEVKVHIPLYGGKVEGWIVKGISDAYDQEAERLTEWLEEI